MQSGMTGRKPSAITALRRNLLFHALPTATLARLAADSTTRNLFRGERLPAGNRGSTGFHAVISGCLVLSMGTAKSGKVMELVSAGGCLGLAATILGTDDAVNAEAIADSTLLLIPRMTLLECVEDTPKFALRLATVLSRQVQALISDIEAVSLHSGHRRVADFLLHLAAGVAPAAETQSPVVTLPAKKSIIASRLNLTPEYFSRVLHDLTTTGSIAVNGRRITVLDSDRLRQREA